MRKLGLFFVVVVVSACLLQGCGVRGEVAREAALEKIDGLLGEMNVKRKSIEQGVEQLEAAIAELRKARIKAEIKAQQLDERAHPVRRSVARLDELLDRLREKSADGAGLQLEGRMIHAAEIPRLIDRYTAQRDDLQRRAAGFAAASERLGQVVRTLASRQGAAEQRLAAVDNRLTVIQSNRLALAALRDASQALEGGAGDVWGNVAELESQVLDLYADVEAELASEDGRWRRQAGDVEWAPGDSVALPLASVPSAWD